MFLHPNLQCQCIIVIEHCQCSVVAVFPSHLYRFHVELHNPLFDKAELLGHLIGEIHIPAFDIGSPVINNPFGGLAVIGVDKPDPGPHGECPVG